MTIGTSHGTQRTAARLLASLKRGGERADPQAFFLQSSLQLSCSRRFWTASMLSSKHPAIINSIGMHSVRGIHLRK